MTPLGINQNSPVQTEVPNKSSLRRVETRLLLRIALPLIGAYVAEYAMFLTTKMVVGRLGYHELAAVGLAGDLAFELLVVLMGLLSIVGVLAAHAEGAGRKRDAGQTVRQGFIVATAIGIPGTVLIWNLDWVLSWMGQDPKVIALTTPYLRGLSGFLLPVLWFSVLRNFVAAISRAGSVLVITVAAVGMNYLLTLGLVHGYAGMPALGVAGAGWATNIVSWAMLVCLTVYIFYTPALRGYGVFFGRLKFDPVLCREILRLGTPIAALVLLEAGLFVAVSILSGVIGAKQLAAHQIIMGWVGIPFVVALGLAEATMVRVAHGMGRSGVTTAREVGILGMVIGVVALTLMMVIPLAVPEQIVRVFMDPSDTGYADVAAIASQLLFIAAIFQVSDGLQAISSRALRGLKDTVAPLWLAGFGYWVLGIGGGCLLAFPMGLGARGLWWGLAIGLIVTSILLTIRFMRLTSPHVSKVAGKAEPSV